MLPIIQFSYSKVTPYAVQPEPSHPVHSQVNEYPKISPQNQLNIYFVTSRLLNSEEIKPVTLAIIELCLSEGIS